LQVSAVEQQCPLVFDFAGDPGQEDVVVHPIKELCKVDIDDPSPALRYVVAGGLSCLMGALAGTETLGACREAGRKQPSKFLITILQIPYNKILAGAGNIFVPCLRNGGPWGQDRFAQCSLL